MSIRSLIPDDPVALEHVARQISRSFEMELLPHFEDEERYVVPRLEALGLHDLVEQMRDEHDRLRIQAAALSEPSEEGIRLFARMLTAHVAFEENVVWEALEPGAGTPFDPPSTDAVNQPAKAAL